jgi:AAA family ATP:ADP antiporter
VFRTLGERQKGPIERALSLFADVRAGEGVGVLLLTLNVFLLLGLYYLLRSARQVSSSRSTTCPSVDRVAAGGVLGGRMAVVLLGVVPLFGWLASRVPRMRLISITTFFFAANLGVFFLLGRAGWRIAAPFSTSGSGSSTSSSWRSSGRLPTICIPRARAAVSPADWVGASLGALVGASSVSYLVRQFAFTPFTLMLVAGGVLLLALGITWVVNNRESATADPEGQKAEQEPLGKEGGFALVLRDPYLRWIGLLTILLNIVNSVGGFLLNQVVENNANAVGRDCGAAAIRHDLLFDVRRTGQPGRTAAAVVRDLAGAQVLGRARFALHPAGDRAGQLLDHRRGAGAGGDPLGKILENSTDYSIQNTLRQALFLPTSREAKYKAKSVIDTFCTRFGDVLQAVVVFGGTAIGLGVWGFAWLNVALTLVWLAVAVQIAREHRKKTV